MIFNFVFDWQPEHNFEQIYDHPIEDYETAGGNIIKDSLYRCRRKPDIVLYCIVLYCIMRPYTDGPIGPLSYRHSSGVVRNPHSTLAE